MGNSVSCFDPVREHPPYSWPKDHPERAAAIAERKRARRNMKIVGTQGNAQSVTRESDNDVAATSSAPEETKPADQVNADSAAEVAATAVAVPEGQATAVVTPEGFAEEGVSVEVDDAKDDLVAQHKELVDLPPPTTEEGEDAIELAEGVESKAAAIAAAAAASAAATGAVLVAEGAGELKEMPDEVDIVPVAGEVDTAADDPMNGVDREAALLPVMEMGLSDEDADDEKEDEISRDVDVAAVAADAEAALVAPVTPAVPGDTDAVTVDGEEVIVDELDAKEMGATVVDDDVEHEGDSTDISDATAAEESMPGANAEVEPELSVQASVVASGDPVSETGDKAASLPEQTGEAELATEPKSAIEYFEEPTTESVSSKLPELDDEGKSAAEVSLSPAKEFQPEEGETSGIDSRRALFEQSADKIPAAKDVKRDILDPVTNELITLEEYRSRQKNRAQGIVRENVEKYEGIDDIVAQERAELAAIEAMRTEASGKTNWKFKHDSVGTQSNAGAFPEVADGEIGTDTNAFRIARSGSTNASLDVDSIPPIKAAMRSEAAPLKSEPVVPATDMIAVEMPALDASEPTSSSVAPIMPTEIGEPEKLSNAAQTIPAVFNEKPVLPSGMSTDTGKSAGSALDGDQSVLNGIGTGDRGTVVASTDESGLEPALDSGMKDTGATDGIEDVVDEIEAINEELEDKLTPLGLPA